MIARVTDDELPTLGPIIAELLEMLDPHVAEPLFRALLANGGRSRVLIIREIDVDVIALARFVRDRSAAGGKAKVIEAAP